jgi:hypothetical protein
MLARSDVYRLCRLCPPRGGPLRIERAAGAGAPSLAIDPATDRVNACAARYRHAGGCSGRPASVASAATEDATPPRSHEPAARSSRELRFPTVLKRPGLSPHVHGTFCLA